MPNFVSITKLQVNSVLQNLSWERAIGGLFVLVIHSAVLFGLWSANQISRLDTTTTVFVNLIDSPPPQPKTLLKRVPPAPVKLAKPHPFEPSVHALSQLVTEAPVIPPTVAPVQPPPASTLIASPAHAPAPAPTAALPAEPINLASDLSVSCPVRTAPMYPALARRMGEEGEVVLRVELSEDGQIVAARVATSSGFRRLDEAALATVKTWRCNPALRDGQPVRAVAMQPFNFILEGR